MKIMHFFTAGQNPATRRASLVFLLAALILAAVAGSALSAGIVKNGSFEKDTDEDGIPNNWTPGGFTSMDKRVCNQSKEGLCSLKEIGDGTPKTLLQNIVISGSAGDTVRLTFWAKGKDLDAGPTHNVQFNLITTYTDDTGNSTPRFVPEGTSPWTLYTLDVVAAKDFDSGQVYIYNDADAGKVWIDKIKVVVVP